ncbi:DUF7269 family protein [Halosolutus gelatinilyticus]|uniref:DUF7269 family protein n=1 Tax=Halosolutus gelatinilyticus TaxID=2931975 RepID=UPI001FF3E2B1|nr:hypothetical protein [Halosolutus gelatinilyticus]
MSRYRHAIIALLGLAFVALGLTLGLGSRPESGSDGPTVALVLLALAAIAVGIRKLRGTPDPNAGEAAAPWADEEFATPAPERTDREPPLSSDGLARVVDEAGAAARRAETVDEGVAVVRPVLRETLRDALVQGGRSRTAVEAAIDDGSWTDDPVAASVLSPTVDPPPRPLRDRLRTWLFPERTVRGRTRRTMAAVAEAAEGALPTVPGRTAPRTVPVLQPRLEELRRGAGGELQRAVDPNAVAGGPPVGRDDGAETDIDEAIDGGGTSGRSTDGTDGTEPESDEAIDRPDRSDRDPGVTPRE